MLRGEQYASAIFFHTPEQKDAAEKVTQELQGLLNSGKFVFKGRPFEGTKVTTAIIPATKCMRQDEVKRNFANATQFQT
jgi:peptide-methionine (S)-S-oxide reductase